MEHHSTDPLAAASKEARPVSKAVIREIREEIEAEITDLELLGILESIFTLEGQLGHEIVFVYQGDLLTKMPTYGRSSLSAKTMGKSFGAMAAAFFFH